MSDYAEKFNPTWVSYHPNRYDIDQARCGDGYGARWARGFRSRTIFAIGDLAYTVTHNVWSPICYRDGHRHSKNFIGAEWIALDFDSGDLTLDQAIDRYQDTVHVIGTTKSHQKDKDGKPPCDRFRVVLRLQHPIKDIATFRATFAKAVDTSEADSAVKDAARYLYPCTELISVCAEGYLHEITAPDKIERNKVKRTDGVFPRWLLDFLFDGKPCSNGSRNWSFYAACMEYVEQGFKDDEILRTLKAARDQHGWLDITDGDLERRLKSAREAK